MQIKDMEYFIKLTEVRNFTQVAQAFKVSQPTITYAVKRLETELNAQLVIRNPEHHSVSITPAAQQFVVHANKVMIELKRARAEIQSQKEAKIKLGLPPIIGNFYFSKFIPQLTKQGLVSKLNTDSFGSEETLAKLLSGDINLALIGSSEPLRSPDLKLFLLRQNPFTIITGSRKDSIKLPKLLSFSQAAVNPFIVFNEGFVHNKAFSYFNLSADVSPQIIYKTTDIGILKNMVSHNAGIGLLTDLAIDSHDKLITHAIIDDNQPLFNIYLAYRRNYQLSIDEKKFVKLFQSHVLRNKKAPGF
ncbi:LysR family transcriptional regulator [Lentilactobacillus kisonensis]|nr:LysR family transcriptional regulator [Lentilactobacillus kisonensis]